MAKSAPRTGNDIRGHAPRRAAVAPCQDDPGSTHREDVAVERQHSADGAVSGSVELPETDVAAPRRLKHLFHGAFQPSPEFYTVTVENCDEFIVLDVTETLADVDLPQETEVRHQLTQARPATGPRLRPARRGLRFALRSW
jgi:hypothetical protein